MDQREREIKFRIWDSLVKEMLKVVSHNFKLGMPNGCYMMQFIGLKDKNGKEIYEGDILRIKNKDGYTIRKVQWDNEKLRFNHILKIHQKCYEVIGNIYENPELLND